MFTLPNVARGKRPLRPPRTTSSLKKQKRDESGQIHSILVSSTGPINSELILTSLNDLRTGIAHDGRVPPGFSMSDFRERLDQMQEFVAAMDRGVASFFCGALIRRGLWNAVMR